jgi:hypothetical protein
VGFVVEFFTPVFGCSYWADISKDGVKFYKDATEKSLALAQKYLDSSGSKKQEFAEEEAKKLDSESKDKSESNTRDGYDTNLSLCDVVHQVVFIF